MVWAGYGLFLLFWGKAIALFHHKSTHWKTYLSFDTGLPTEAFEAILALPILF